MYMYVEILHTCNFSYRGLDMEFRVVGLQIWYHINQKDDQRILVHVNTRWGLYLVSKEKNEVPLISLAISKY